MTPTELLALLGRAWSRLFLFPGGLAAFALAWAGGYAVARWTQQGKRSTSRPINPILDTAAMLFPWLGLALLPLPPAPPLSRQTDLIVTIACMEVPLLVVVRHELRQGMHQRLAAALNGYPPLVLATLALVQANGSFDPAILARLPGDLAPVYAIPLHWVGVVGWLLALPPLLGVGPFAAPMSFAAKGGISFQGKLLATARAGMHLIAGWLPDPLQTGLWLRGLGYVLLAALPWMGALGTLDEGGLRTGRGFAAWLLAPLLIAAFLWTFARLTKGSCARLWARFYLVLDAVLLLALLWASYTALAARLA